MALMETRNILILTADTGFGHRSTSLALARAFELRYGDGARVTIANPLDDPKAPSLLRNAESDYDKIASEWPHFYELGYRMADTAVTTNVKQMAYVVLTYDLIARLMRRHEPDVVVVTFPNYHTPVDVYRRLSGDNTPMATVITDLATLQRTWFHKEVDLCLAPTEIAAKLAFENGVPLNRIRVTGLPVNPALAEAPPSKAKTRAALGWDPDLFTVLAVGSKRVEGLERFVQVLNTTEGFACQIVAVAGGNDELYEAWQQTDWHVPAFVYNFVKDMPDFLHAADCVITKAGGLIVSESLACGLPLFLMQVIPGQETGNAQLVVHEGAGDRTPEPINLAEGMARWLADNGRLYQVRASNARRIGRPRAAFDAADLLWQLAGQEAYPSSSRLSGSLEGIKDILRQFNVLDGTGNRL
jgi:1,2-diacylglycerol 3-beta-galactosyltransferase